MSQALYTSMGGIAAAQTSIDVVSNNIANINTIGYKEANVTFQDIFSTTLTAGNAPTVTSGGRNPIQIGLGVQVGAISKNFDAGTWSSTGRATDMMIQGNGFFTVMSPEGEMFLTRAGNFTFDNNGDLVTSQGFKVVGADQLYGTTGSSSTVNVPQKFVTSVSANEAMGTKLLSELNDCKLKMGTFTINITDSAGVTTPVEVELTNQTTMAQVAAKIQADLGLPADCGVTVKCDASTNGTIQFVTNGTEAKSLTFESGSSNFVLATQIGSAKIDGSNTYSSKVLDHKVGITDVTSLEDAVSISNYTFASDGSIEATYSNGDKLTIELNDADQTFQFKYTTATGVIIRGNDVTVNPNVALPSNFQIQLANVVNPEGLVSMGGNLYMPGPNAGEMMFTVGDAMGLGAIKSGGLEASNVDMSRQFSNMIVAQRAVQANSRVFDTASSVLETLVYLGRG